MLGVVGLQVVECDRYFQCGYFLGEMFSQWIVIEIVEIVVGQYVQGIGEGGLVEVVVGLWGFVCDQSGFVEVWLMVQFFQFVGGGVGL